MKTHPECADPWAQALIEGKPIRLASVVMANKTARDIGAVLTKNEYYRPHTALLREKQKTRDCKTIEMMEHSQTASRDTSSNVRDILLTENRFGTWFAETIRASGHVRRANRPDTRLLLTSAKLASNTSCFAAAIRTGQSLKEQFDR